MKRWLILLLVVSLWAASLAFAQGGMGPGPGTPHAAGGGGNFVNDTLSGESSQVDITAHTGETGATWTYHPTDFVASWFVTTAGRAWSDGGDGRVYASGTPPSANYTVEGNYVFVGASNTSITGIAGRMNTTTADWYAVLYDSEIDTIRLVKFVGGSVTDLGSSSAYTASVNDTLDLKLNLNGTSIKGEFQVNGGGYTVVATVTDSAHSAAGKAGLVSQGASSSTTGMHVTRIFAY